MTGFLKLVGALAILGGVIYYFAPTDQKDRIRQKLEQIGGSSDVDDGTPKIVREQQRKERIQHTISDLQLKNVIEGEKGIRDALDAINDSMASLGVDYDDPALADIVQPSQAQSIDAEFEKLMAE